MTDREARIEHNRQAIEAAERAKQALYPGMISAVEMPKECMNGKGIVAVTDDVFELIAEQHKYHPAFMSVSASDDGVEKQSSAPVEERQTPVSARPTTVKTVERKPLSALL